MVDEQLMRRIAARDAEAFDALRERWESAVRRRLLSIVRNAETAEDLCQETFLRVWTKSEQWDGGGSAESWLMRIATNLALNHLRTTRRRKEIKLTDLRVADESGCQSSAEWPADEDAVDPESAVEEAERFSQLRALVAELPEEKREVIRLVYEAEMDIRETARILGVPEGTVKSRLHYSAKHLAREWRNLENE